MDEVGDAHEPGDLRRRAERLLRGQVPALPATEADIRRLVHELQVHQIELELQNESLRLARDASEVALAQFTDLYDFAPVGYLSFDHAGCIRKANVAGAQLLGVAREQLLGRRFQDFVDAAARPAVSAVLARVLGGAMQQSCDAVLGGGGGGDPPVCVRLAVVADVVGVSSRAVLMDVTEARRLAAELEHYQTHLEDLVALRTSELHAARELAESANRTKTAFLANMSHEIRTPINAIVGMTALLQRESPTPTQRNRLGKLSDAAAHLMSIIDDVLDLSKIEAGKLVLESADFTVAVLLESVVQQMADKARQKGLRFAVHAGDLPAALHGDVTRLRQVLLNYLSNAIKFTEVGEITLRCRVVDEDEHGILARFNVIDSGIGVREDQVPTLFNRFEQADNSMTRRYGGTGLGLAINRHLAERMGGEVGVDRSVGQGSDFWFTARLGKVEAQPAPEAVPQSSANEEALLRSRYAGTRVLLAEDNPVNQYLATMLLESVALHVDAAETGAAAVAMAAAGHYDLILMDMQMPEMDGLEATRAIRLLAGHAATPIIAMTANAFHADRQLCLQAGMNDHLPKPVHPHALYAMVLKWLQSDADADAAGAPGWTAT